MSLSFCDFLSGWGAGICGLLVGHPADTIKVRQQTRTTQFMKLVYSAIKHEGIRGFYKGMSFPLLAAGTQNAIFFGVYGNTLRVLQKLRNGGADVKTRHEEHKPDKYWYLDVYLAGCAAGFVQCFSGCPVDLIKVKLQAHSGNANTSGVLDAVKHIHREFGLKGFYQGFHTMLIRDVIASGVYTLVYAACVSATSRPKDVVTVLLAGGLAGMVSWIAIIPLDVIKSRLQADNLGNPVYKGMIDCIIKSYHSDGLRVFGRGFWMISLRAFPVNAATFAGYEWCLRGCQEFMNT